MTQETPTLPSEAAIDAGMASLESDVAEMFGFGGDEGADGGAPPSPEGEPAAPGAGEDSAPAPAPDTSAEGEPPSPAEPAPGTEPAPASPPAAPADGSAPTAPPAAQVDEQALKMQSLEATVEALQAEIARARANPVSAEGPAGESGQPAAPQPPRYNLTLPEAVANAIFNEDDPRQRIAGISHMMNSLAGIVHHNVRLETQQMIGSLLQQAQAQESSVNQSQEIAQGREAYFAAFPSHKNEMLMPLIQAEARQMAAEFPGLQWGDQYINALGARVNARVAALTPQPAASNVPPAPAASIPQGVNDRREGSPVSGEELIFDTFS